MLKVSFPLAIDSGISTYEIPYGTIVRNNNGEEEPGQSWIDLSGITRQMKKKINYGISLLNDSKYGFSVQGNEIRMSLIRSPIYAWHDPKVQEPGVEYKYTDQGEHYFKYSLVPHKGDWRKAGIPRLAYEFSNPLIKKTEDAHTGEYPRELSFLEVEPSSLITTVLKKEEKYRDFILRFYETSGTGGIAHISFPWLKISFKESFEPYEIKTLRINLNEKPSVIEKCNLLEETI
jgi:alpha-mannosidase